MARKRPSASDAIGDIAPPFADKPQPKEPTRSRYQKYGKPATYRLPEELIKEVKTIAKTERVKISDLVTFVLQSFVRDYERGEVDLPKSEPARYRLDLE